MMKLYYAPKTCAIATHIALEESGAPYEAVKIDFSKGEQNSPEFLAINPKGRVPVLHTDEGTLTETPALLLYVAQTSPEAKLAPGNDPFALAELQAFNSYLCSTVHPYHSHKVRGSRWADDEAALGSMKRKVQSNMAMGFDLIERKMFKGPWVMGENYSVADPYLFTIALWLEGDDVDIARFPKVHDHFKRMQARPAVERVLAVH